MEVKVLFPPNKEIADLQAIVCAVAMRSTRTKEPAHELLSSRMWTRSCIWNETILKHYDECHRLEDSKKCQYYDRCVERMLKQAKQMKHWGVFEHATFTVSVSGVSRALTHQLVRHRQNSFLQQSQKAVEIDISKDDWYIVPKTVSVLELGGSHPEREGFYKLMKETAKVYKGLIDSGIPDEDARYVLPNACKTHIVITANVRQWLHIFYMRLSEHAQWEIREMCRLILDEFMKLSPVMFEGAGELEV